LRPIAQWGIGVLQDEHPAEIDGAVRLLTAAATRADASTKTWLAERLGFSDRSKGKTVHEPIFRALGLRPADDDLKSFAADAVRQIGLQVQRGAPGFAPDTNISYALQSGFTAKSEQIYLFIPGGARTVDLVVAYGKYLERTSIEQLFDSSLAQIENPDNALANRTFLVEDVGKLAPYLSEAEAEELMAVLERVASGPVEESRFAGANTNPLSPIQANLGTPADLQATAVLAISNLANRPSDRFSARITNVLSKALAHGTGTIRSAGIAAVNQLSAVPEDLLLGMLAATRDSDANVRATIFSVFSSHEGLHLNVIQKWFLVFSIRQSFDTPNVQLRWAAAKTLTSPVLRDLPEDLRGVREEIQRSMAADPSRAVRSLATSPAASSPGIGPDASPADRNEFHG
jgi:hypothetical protein